MAVQVFTGGAALTSPTQIFGLSATTPCTIMAWLRATDASAWTTPTSMVGVYGPAAPTSALQLGCWASGQFACWTWGGSPMVQATGFTSPVGSWDHYCITYDGTTFRLYINAVLNNTTLSTQLSGILGRTYINGFPTSGTSETGNFSVDDFMLFDRQVSEDEIRTIYNLEGPRDGIVQGCLARYTYEEAPPGATVVAGVDITQTGATMTPGTGTPAVYIASRAMTNLRSVQG